MPLQVYPDDAIRYLERFLTHNKARGMVAELGLASEIGIAGTASEKKLLSGGWLMSPKDATPKFQRCLVFVLPNLYVDEAELRTAVHELEQDRGWQALATFLDQSAIGVIVSGAWSTSKAPDLDGLVWVNHVYSQERLLPANGNQPFTLWGGGKGYARSGDMWQADVIHRFNTAPETELTTLALRQAFFYGYLKNHLRKSLDDPYDVDAFVVSYTGTVMPVEIKEKSPTPRGDFGIDAGRILMLLRLCLATDSNALYLIRQVDENSTRGLVGWKYITLADMVIGCSWNLQAGGRGMGGGSTQTVMISGDLFKDFSLLNFSEDWLAKNKSLQESVRKTAHGVARGLSRYLMV